MASLFCRHRSIQSAQHIDHVHQCVKVDRHIFSIFIFRLRFSIDTASSGHRDKFHFFCLSVQACDHNHITLVSLSQVISLGSRPKSTTFTYPVSCSTSSEIFKFSAFNSFVSILLRLLAKITVPIAKTANNVEPKMTAIFFLMIRKRILSFFALSYNDVLSPRLLSFPLYHFFTKQYILHNSLFENSTFLHIFRGFQKCTNPLSQRIFMINLLWNILIFFCKKGTAVVNLSLKH